MATNQVDLQLAAEVLLPDPWSWGSGYAPVLVVDLDAGAVLSCLSVTVGSFVFADRFGVSLPGAEKTVELLDEDRLPLGTEVRYKALVGTGSGLSGVGSVEVRGWE